MIISIVTLFPQMFAGPFDHSIIKNAIAKKIVEIDFVDLRDFGMGPHRVVDDKPYGGGTGMILKVDVVEKAISKAKLAKVLRTGQKVVLLDPRGKTYDQRKAKELSKIKHLILVCGHYEGIDERIDNFVDEKISVGDFILTGGEIPAMVITDSVVRLLILKKQATEIESFSPCLPPQGRAYLEHPQYTKPRAYKNYVVPEVLLHGDHKKIEEWRKKASLAYTKKLRPDLLKTSIS